MATEVKITRIVEEPHILSSGNIERRKRVEFMVGDLGPLSVSVSEEEFQAGKTRELIEKQAREIRALQGLT